MKQRLIDANKLRANICKWLKPSVPYETEMVAIDDIGVSVYMEIEEQPTVFEIPDNPTNGDMIKAIFPYIEIKDNCDMYYSVNIENLSIDKGLNTVGFRKDWWNAPYKKENKYD